MTDNVGVWWDQPLTPWVVVAVVAVLGVAAIRSRPGRAAWGRIAVPSAIVVVPVIGWYVVLNNHSQIHSWLVYRSLPIAFGACRRPRVRDRDDRTGGGASLHRRGVDLALAFCSSIRPL